jgi:hypothetical protein
VPIQKDNTVAHEPYEQKSISSITFFRDLLFLFLSSLSVGLSSSLRYFEGTTASFSLSEVSGIGELGTMTVMVAEIKVTRKL